MSTHRELCVFIGPFAPQFIELWNSFIVPLILKMQLGRRHVIYDHSNNTTMQNFSKYLFIATWLCASLCLQSCNEQSTEFEKQKVQFSLSLASTSSGSVGEIDLPENARAMITVASRDGSVLSNHDIAVYKTGDVYITDPLTLTPGAYMITDLMIVKDSVGLYVTPKKGAELNVITDALPHNFSIAANNTAIVSMQVMDVRDQDLQKFGYVSAKAKSNTLSIAVYDNGSLTSATAELRQNKTLLKTFSLTAGINTISFGGDQKVPYTLTVYTAHSANAQTFNIKALKRELGKNPLEIVLEPALVLTTESYVDVGNEYEEYFEFRMEGTGSVNINWGDGEQSATTLPFELSHEYILGEYKLIVTGDIHQVTDFLGFSYGTIIKAITGLTNLDALKIYDPSWGAVPIKVDLSNCTQLERINIAKYGAPYEPIDLRTDFKLPTEHFINAFIFDAPSFDSNREFISAEELDVLFSNIYDNAITRQIYGGQFLLNPVVAPLPATQEKIDILISEYNWQVAFNDDIWGVYNSEFARSSSTQDSNEHREQWLRERFSDSKRIIQRAEVASAF